MTDNLRGILAVLIGSTGFVGHDAIIKLVSAELPSSEIIVVRGLIASVLFVAAVIAAGATRPLSILLEPLMLVRVLATAGATVFIVLALRYLPLATATTVLQAAPLLVTGGAAMFYGDVVGWRRWAAILTGFVGVILIVKPGGDFGAAAWLILIALLCTTTRDLATRGLAKNIPSLFVAAAGTVAAAAAGFVLVPIDDAWSLPTPWAWGLMLASSVFLVIATTAIVTGLRTGEIAVVAPFRYVLVPFALLLGWWLWGDIPDAIAFGGIGLVLGAGLYTLHRERATLRRAS